MSTIKREREEAREDEEVVKAEKEGSNNKREKSKTKNRRWLR